MVRSPKELSLMVINQRKKLNLSQRAVSQLTGLKQQTISEFEIRPENTKLNTLFLILSAVKLDVQLVTKNKPIETERWKEEW